MNKIQIRLYSDANGVLSLNIPVELQNTEFLITIEPVSNEQTSSSEFRDSTDDICHHEPIDVNEEGIYDDLDELL